MLLDGTEYLRSEKDNEVYVEEEGEHDLTKYDKLQDMEEEFQKYQVFIHSDGILKQMQKKAPYVISSSVCVDSFQKQSSKRRETTCFWDEYLLLKRVLSRIFAERFYCHL